MQSTRAFHPCPGCLRLAIPPNANKLETTPTSSRYSPCSTLTRIRSTTQLRRLQPHNKHRLKLSLLLSRPPRDLHIHRRSNSGRRRIIQTIILFSRFRHRNKHKTKRRYSTRRRRRAVGLIVDAVDGQPHEEESRNVGLVQVRVPQPEGQAVDHGARYRTRNYVETDSMACLNGCAAHCLRPQSAWKLNTRRKCSITPSRYLKRWCTERPNWKSSWRSRRIARPWSG